VKVRRGRSWATHDKDSINGVKVQTARGTLKGYEEGRRFFNVFVVVHFYFLFKP
jgi:hypothetical protein